jgi:AcrR family transcriptional regulator
MAEGMKKGTKKRRGEDASTMAKATRPTRRRRLEPADREREILDGAVAFFTEVGFDGGLRDLAKRLGITHQNLFRYFPTTEALIERVYEEVYLSRWQPEWGAILQDTSRPLDQRLIERRISPLSSDMTGSGSSCSQA